MEYAEDPSISETSFFHSLGLQIADRTDVLSQVDSAPDDPVLEPNVETIQNNDMSFFDAIGRFNICSLKIVCSCLSILFQMSLTRKKI